LRCDTLAVTKSLSSVVALSHGSATLMDNYSSCVSRFRRDVAQIINGRSRIISTCTRCGESQVLSRYDGSLEKWEREHEANLCRLVAHRMALSNHVKERPYLQQLVRCLQQIIGNVEQDAGATRPEMQRLKRRILLLLADLEPTKIDKPKCA
jgi:hypothetical protein